jgi:transposase
LKETIIASKYTIFFCNGIPSPDEGIQNICMDKGYDFSDIRKLVKEYGYTVHIKSRGEENIRIDIPGFRARRWVVERTHSWLNRFRRLLIRREKKIKITLLCYI